MRLVETSPIPLSPSAFAVGELRKTDPRSGGIVAALENAGMLQHSVVGFSSDNGGPLDHANNWPRRGGKHTFYEGVRRNWIGRHGGIGQQRMGR